MPFYRTHDGQGTMHVNFGRRRRGPAACVGDRLPGDDLKIGLKCFRISVALCDAPAGSDVDGKTLTCDAPICEHHRTSVGANLDRCPRHSR